MIELKERIIYKIETVKLWTARVLRDFPELREIKMRRELIKKVNQISGEDFYSETITRSARWIQNTKGLYQAKGNDLEQIHKEVWK